MFFSFEGIDGSGKSTQARLLADSLRQRGHTVVEVREPGGTELGERVRSLLLDPSSQINPRAELLLFSAARAQLVSEVIKPALTDGAIVLADRFYDSSTAYQGAGRELADQGWMSSLHLFATEDISPDRTYLIDISPTLAASRRRARVEDRMEGGGDSFYKRVRERYLEIAESSRVRALDGAQTVEQLQDLIYRDASELLHARG